MVWSPAGLPPGEVTLRAGDSVCSAPAARGHCPLVLPAGPVTVQAELAASDGFAPASASLTLDTRDTGTTNPTLAVTTTAMTVDGDCVSLQPDDLGEGDTLTSLPEALCVANNRPGADTVSLAPGQLYVLDAHHNHWFGPNGLPPITSPIQLAGNGATLRRDGRRGVQPRHIGAGQRPAAG